MIDRIVAEQTLIGCILLDSKMVMPEALATIPDEGYFVAPDCRLIYEKCRKRFLEQRPIDTVTVLHDLGGEREGYKEHLIRLAEAVPCLTNYREYIGAVYENAKREAAQEKLLYLADMLRDGASLSDCQQTASQILENLSSNTGSSCVTADDGYKMVADSLDKPRNYIKTGFSHLDQFVLFDRGDYMVIGGRPSSGKTAFSLQIVLNMAREYTVCFFSLETSARKIYERLLACFTRTPFGEISRGHVQDKKKLLNERERFSQLHLNVIDAAGWTVQQIGAKALQTRAEIIVVDYLGLVYGTGKSLYERITNISMDLHTLAQRSRISILALSQLNRAGDGEPDMTNLRESGQIEQDADAILLLNTPGDKGKKQTGERSLIIAKNKSGRVGKINFAFDGNFQRFAEICERGDEECRPF